MLKDATFFICVERLNKEESVNFFFMIILGSLMAFCSGILVQVNSVFWDLPGQESLCGWPWSSFQSHHEENKMSMSWGCDFLGSSSSLPTHLVLAKFSSSWAYDQGLYFVAGCHQRPFPTPKGCHCSLLEPCLPHGSLPLQGQQERVGCILESLWLLFPVALLFWKCSSAWPSMLKRRLLYRAFQQRVGTAGLGGGCATVYHIDHYQPLP